MLLCGRDVFHSAFVQPHLQSEPFRLSFIGAISCREALNKLETLMPFCKGGVKLSFHAMQGHFSFCPSEGPCVFRMNHALKPKRRLRGIADLAGSVVALSVELMDAAVLADSLTRRAEGLASCLLPAAQCRQRAPMHLQSEAAVPYVSGRE